MFCTSNSIMRYTKYMNKIQKLSPHEAQKIAAGEVVERPANVVKELLENSLDAGATSITIYLENGGKKLIRVVDNGDGMSPADARMSVVHHATSKITTVDQLETLTTFGFRGEALSSIAAISTMTLITKEAHTQEATKLTITHGSIAHEELCAAPQGTDITIDNIFENVPARRKFLKSDETERRVIVQLFQAMCFAYPTVHFKLYHNDTLVHNCPPVRVLERIHQLFDTRMHQHMLEAITTEPGLSITAFFSDHQYTRYDRSALFFLVNKRWVKNYKLSQAFIKAYANVLPTGKYPAGVVALTVDTRQVDINIHPRKEEVQFLHPRAIESALTQCIKKALEAKLVKMIQPIPPTQEPIHIRAPFLLQYDSAEITKDVRAIPQKPLSNKWYNQPITSHTHPEYAQHVSNEKGRQETFVTPTEGAQLSTIIGQVHATYILIETKTGLSLVDQHAAHERILYEQFSQRFHEVSTVQLVFPHVITLKEQDLVTIQEHRALFKEHGIIFEQTSPHQVVVTGIPVPYKNHSVEELIHQVIAWVHELQMLDTQLFFKKITEKLRAQMACKAAVKAGDMLTREKMEALIAALAKTENRLTCPHGRPTHWNISLTDIQKIFKRI